MLTVGGSLTGLSYRVQRRLGPPFLRYRNIGFALVTLSPGVKVRHTPGLVRVDDRSNSTLLLYTIEPLLVATGVGNIAYAILQ